MENFPQNPAQDPDEAEIIRRFNDIEFEVPNNADVRDLLETEEEGVVKHEMSGKTNLEGKSGEKYEKLAGEVADLLE